MERLTDDTSTGEFLDFTAGDPSVTELSPVRGGHDDGARDEFNYYLGGILRAELGDSSPELQ